MNSDSMAFNGINGATGDYLLPSMTPLQISKIVQGESQDEAHIKELKWWYDRITRVTLGPKEGVEPNDLSQAGWGVIFAHGADPSIRDALSELLAHRREMAGRTHENFYREFIDADGYRPNESKLQFLSRHGVGPGPPDPAKMPYYLLIVGDPEVIPYRFQYQLDVQYAVGRIHFDSLDDYAAYASSVVEAETGQLSLPREAVFFGVQNPDDRATALSANELVRPLAACLAEARTDWRINLISKEETNKTQLSQLLGGDSTPAILFTASHGMGFPNGDRRQLWDQGALLCSDWPGPLQWRTTIPEAHYYSGNDIESSAWLNGMVTFHFACYGAGTPRLDDFAHQSLKKPVAIAPHAFVAHLPQKLLTSGALASIGHVERAWGYSFMWPGAGGQLAVFESTLKRLMAGHTVGSAVEYFNERYAELATDLSIALEDIKKFKQPDDQQLAGIWTANNDARSYVIIGDPAVRLPLAD
jgi:hypothetical protein